MAGAACVVTVFVFCTVVVFTVTVGVVAVAFLIGRRKGRRRTTVVEVRRL